MLPLSHQYLSHISSKFRLYFSYIYLGLIWKSGTLYIFNWGLSSSRHLFSFPLWTFSTFLTLFLGGSHKRPLSDDHQVRKNWDCWLLKVKTNSLREEKIFSLSEWGVPPNSVLFGGTVPPNSVLFGGTVPPNSFPLFFMWLLTRLLPQLVKTWKICFKKYCFLSVFFSLFKSHLNFGNILWGCAQNKFLNKISNLQKQWIRNVLNQSSNRWTFWNLVTNCPIVGLFSCNNIDMENYPPLSRKFLMRQQCNVRGCPVQLTWRIIPSHHLS